MRLIVFLITAVTQVVVAVSCFFVLLVGLNGYSERQATPSLILYVVFSLISILGMSFIAGVTAKYFVDKHWMSNAIASVVAIIISWIVGALIVIGGMFVAFVVAETLRGTR